MSNEQDKLEEFKDKKRFVIFPAVGQQWIIEVYDFDDRLLGRVVVGNKAELIQSMDENIPDDKMEVDFGIN